MIAKHSASANIHLTAFFTRLRKTVGTRFGWLLVGCFSLPVFCCGLSLCFYLTFPPQPLNILVAGLDARTGEGYLARTDSIMLIGASPGQLRLSILAIPRDLFIDVPRYGSQRINTINLLGEQEEPGSGMKLLSDSIRGTFGTRVDRYIRIEFSAFVKLVDAVGGLTIDVERTIIDEAYPSGDEVISIRFDQGLQTMNGERALIYARTRHADDDYARAKRQQQVVSALLSRLVNPVRWPAAWSVFQASVDTNLQIVDFLALVPPVILNRGRYDQLVIDRDYIVGSAAGHALPDIERILPWLEEHFE